MPAHQPTPPADESSPADGSASAPPHERRVIGRRIEVKGQWGQVLYPSLEV